MLDLTRRLAPVPRKVLGAHRHLYGSGYVHPIASPMMNPHGEPAAYASTHLGSVLEIIQHFVVFVWLCVAAIGCDRADPSPPGGWLGGVQPRVIDTAPNRVPHAVLGDTVLAIPGEGPPYFENPTAAVLLKTGLAVVDGAKVVLVDSSGDPGRVIGRAGDGPGEFRSIGNIGRGGGDRWFVFDRRHWRITWFTPHGSRSEIVSLRPVEQPLRWVAAWPVGCNGRAAGYAALGMSSGFSGEGEPEPAAGSGRRYSTVYYLVRFDSSGTETGERLRLGSVHSWNAEQRIDARYPFDAPPSATADCHEVRVAHDEQYMVARLSAELVPVEAVRWSPQERALGEDEVAEVQNVYSNDALMRAAPDYGRRLIAGLFESVPEVRPAIAELVVDRSTRRMWVRRWEPRELDRPDVWYVHAGEGTPVAQLRLGRRERLLGVHSDTLIVAATDDQDLVTVLTRRVRMAPGAK